VGSSKAKNEVHAVHWAEAITPPVKLWLYWIICALTVDCNPNKITKMIINLEV
jgi:hypothetical protein